MERSSNYHQYTPLPSDDHIRILVLQPSPGTGGTLHCTLETATPHAEAEYTALSYSWAMQDGDATRKRDIYISGARKAITQNLSDALRRLRPRKDSLRLWVDAVCINQADNRERSRQVAKMYTIFSNATEVVAWLGEGESALEDKNAHAIFSCLGDCWAREPRDILAFNESHMFSPFEGDEISLCELAKSGSHDLLGPQTIESIRDASNALLARRYWSRRWILQEIHSESKNRVTLRWGSNALGKGHFQAALDHLGFGRTLFLRGDSDVFLRSTFRTNMLLDEHLFEKSVEESLCYCGESRMECSDPRDRLFSLINICNDCDIVPDYNKSMEQVCIDFAKDLIRRKGLNFALANSGLSKRASRRLPGFPLLEVPDLSSWEFSGLPSWVPDLENSLRPVSAVPMYPRDLHFEEYTLIYEAYKIGIVTHGKTRKIVYAPATGKNNSGTFLSKCQSDAKNLRLMTGDILCDILPPPDDAEQMFRGHRPHIIRPIRPDRPRREVFGGRKDTFELVGALYDFGPLYASYARPLEAIPPPRDEHDTITVRLV